MDLGIIIAIATGVITVVGSMFGMIFWCRSEMTAIRELIHGIQLENKDFHYRLLEIERSRKIIIRSPE